MTDTYRECTEKVIEMNERMIASSTEDIKMCNEELAKQRKKDREFVEWIWSSGVVTEWEMNYYNKDYKSEDTKRILKRRAFEYRFRKSLENYNKHFRKSLAE